MPGRTWETCRAGHRFNASRRDKRPEPLARSLTRAGGGFRRSQLASFTSAFSRYGSCTMGGDMPTKPVFCESTVQNKPKAERVSWELSTVRRQSGT